MKISEVANPEITFRIESRGFHHGQSDRVLVAYRSREPVGQIEYSDYQDQPYVQMISVPEGFRRQGIGTALVKRLQAEYPGIEINMGNLTGDGSKLLATIPHEVRPNDEYLGLQARLEQLQRTEQEYQRLADAFHANPNERARLRVLQLTDNWNALHDEISQIEDRLAFTPPSTRVFQ